MVSINTGSGSARGGLGGAYQDEQGWETGEETNLPETLTSEDKKQALLKLEQQAKEAKEKRSAQIVKRGAKAGKLEEIFEMIGGIGAAAACMMHFIGAGRSEVLEGYLVIPAGGIAGYYAGKYIGRLINYCNNCMDQAATKIAEDNYKKTDEEDKSDDNRTSPGIGYPV